jgi:excisionase family DNA binding protein
MTAHKRETSPPITDLQNHPSRYVTALDLARYWRVSLKSIYRLVEEGSLTAIRLGPRLLRILIDDAIRFDRKASIAPPCERQTR